MQNFIEKYKDYNEKQYTLSYLLKKQRDKQRPIIRIWTLLAIICALTVLFGFVALYFGLLPTVIAALLTGASFIAEIFFSFLVVKKGTALYSNISPHIVLAALLLQGVTVFAFLLCPRSPVLGITLHLIGMGTLLAIVVIFALLYNIISKQLNDKEMALSEKDIKVLTEYANSQTLILEINKVITQGESLKANETQQQIHVLKVLIKKISNSSQEDLTCLKAILDKIYPNNDKNLNEPSHFALIKQEKQIQLLTNKLLHLKTKLDLVFLQKNPTQQDLLVPTPGQSWITTKVNNGNKNTKNNYKTESTNGKNQTTNGLKSSNG